MINLKLNYPNGVSLELAIPLNLPASTQSTVVTPDEQETTQETASPAQESQPSMSWSQASDQLTDALNQLSESLEKAEILIEGKGVGEDGEGDGRIGGMGERKEVGGQGEGREGEITYDEGETVSIYNFKFPAKEGIYTPPQMLVSDFVKVFGEENVLTEFLKARAWLIANPAKQKKLRGMGRFLNSWICHQNGFKRVSIKQQIVAKTGSLIDDAKEVSEGW